MGGSYFRMACDEIGPATSSLLPFCVYTAATVGGLISM